MNRSELDPLYNAFFLFLSTNSTDASMDTFAALALATEPSDPNVMNQKPRKQNAFIVTKGMAWQIFITSFVFLICSIVLLSYLKHVHLGNTFGKEKDLRTATILLNNEIVIGKDGFICMLCQPFKLMGC